MGAGAAVGTASGTRNAGGGSAGAGRAGLKGDGTSELESAGAGADGGGAVIEGAGNGDTCVTGSRGGRKSELVVSGGTDAAGICTGLIAAIGALLGAGKSDSRGAGNSAADFVAGKSVRSAVGSATFVAGNSAATAGGSGAALGAGKKSAGGGAGAGAPSLSVVCSGRSGARTSEGIGCGAKDGSAFGGGGRMMARAGLLGAAAPALLETGRLHAGHVPVALAKDQSIGAPQWAQEAIVG